MHRFIIYLKYWWTSALLSVQTAFENRTAALFFLAGKFIRFFLFLGFITLLHSQVQNLKGYSQQDMITFFLVFNLLDLFGQIFFRGIYWFRQQVVSGEFDFRLTKPLSSLFQALTRQTDILDFPLLLLVLFMLIRQPFNLTLSSLIIFCLLLISAIIIITSIHIIVATLGVVTTEVDHTIMIYRDLSSMARFPIDIYTDAIRAILTFVIPIALAFTFPAKALLGLLNFQIALIVTLTSLAIFIICLKLWRLTLKNYSSASS